MSHRALGPQFMTAHELRHNTNALDVGGFADHEEMWQYKSEEKGFPTHGTGGEPLDEHIRQHGVREPVVVAHIPGESKPVLADGHHRVAAAYSVDPYMLIPVRHQLGRR